jgi:TonB-dependent SusC/RagA subfamily outer membrane receptor
MILWMAYAVALGVLVGAAVKLVEPVALSRGRPTRHLWTGAMALSLLLPALALVRPTSGPSPSPEARAENSASLGALVDLERVVVAEPALLRRVEPWVLSAWLAASAGLLLCVGGGLLRLGRRARSWPAIRTDDVEVLVSDDFGPALLAGTGGRIVIPRWALGLDAERMRMVVAHEEEHRRAGDVRLLLAGVAAVVLLPWNPGLWWQLRRLRAAVEVDCDRRVLALGVRPGLYGSLLLDLGTRAPGLPLPIAAWSPSKSLLERRLTMIVRGAKPIGRVGGWAAMATAGLLVALACETPAPTGIQPVPDGQEAGAVPVSPVAEKVVSVVRGMGSGGPGPLVYVDGVRSADGIPELDPDDIARIEVLKGPAAAAMYGEQAAGGVIQIYTKDAHPELASEGPQGLMRRRAGPDTGKLRPIGEAPDEGRGVVRRMESARVFVDGQLYEGDVTAIDKSDIDRVEVVKGRDGGRDTIYITLKKGR